MDDEIRRRTAAREQRAQSGSARGSSAKLAEAVARSSAQREGRDRISSLLERPDNSIVGQLGNTIKAAVTQGPAQIIKAGATEAISPIRMGVDLIKDGGLRTGEEGGVFGAWGEYGTLSKPLAEDANLAARHTVLPFVGTDPVTGFGRLQDRWQETSDDHQTVDALFSVAGTAAVGAGTAARLVGRAGRVAQVGSTADRAVVSGITRGSPRSLSAGASSAARNRATTIVPHRQAQQLHRAASAGTRPARTTTLPTSVPVRTRGTGLAGAAQRAGYDTAAARIDTVGRGLRKATRLLDAPDNLTVGWQLAGAGKLASAGTRAGLGAARRLAPIFNEHSKAGADNWVNQRVDPAARERRGMGEALWRLKQSLEMGVRKDGADTLGLIREAGIDEGLGTVVLNSFDQRYDNLADSLEPMIDEAETLRAQADAVGREDAASAAQRARADELDALVDRAIDERFRGLQPDMRPSREGLRAIIEFRRNPDSQPAQAMVEIYEEMDRAQRARTDRALEGGMNPEQLGDQPLTQVVDRERAEIEKKRDAADAARNRTYGPQERAQAVDRARAAANVEIPDPPNQRALLKQGYDAGVAYAAMRALHQEFKTAQGHLRQAVDEYIQRERMDGANDPMVRRLAAELDRLTDEAVALEQRVLEQRRQLDATAGLSKASGEFETVDADGNPVDPQVQIQGEINEIVARPDPDLSNMTTTDAIETAAREVVDEIRAEVYSEIEAMTNGERPRRPGPDDAGGEFDWYRDLSAAQKRAYGMNKWVAEPGRGTTPDDFARVVNAQLNADLSIDAAISRYLELVDQSMELRHRGEQSRTRGKRRTTSDPVPTRVVETVAERMDVSPEVVRAALNGGPKAERIAALREALADDVRAGYNSIREAWDAMDDDMRTLIIDEGRRIAADGTPADLFDYVMDVVNDNGLDGRDVMSVYGHTDGAALFDWLAGTDPVVPAVFVRAITETPGPTQRRLVKRMQDSLKASKAALRERYSQQRSLRRLVDSARREADARVEDAAGRVDVAEIQMDATQARLEDHMENRPRLDQTASVTDRSRDGWRRPRMWDRTDPKRPRPLREPRTPEEAARNEARPDADNTGTIAYRVSRYETSRIREGQSREIARVARRDRRTTVNRAQRLNDKIADLKNELTRSHQARLIEDINIPTVKSMFNAVRKQGKRLGDVLPARGDIPAQLTGLMDSITRRLIGDDGMPLGRDGMLAVARYMEQRGPFDSVTARHGAFLDAIAELGAEIAEGTDAFRDLRDSMMAEVALEAMADAQNAAIGGASNMNLPYRIRDAWRAHEAGFSQDFRNTIDAQLARYETRRNKHLRETFDIQLEAMPGRWRKLGTALIADMRTFLTMAEDAIARGDLYEAELFHRLAEDTPTSLQQMIDAGYDPTHLVGGDPVPVEGASVSSSAKKGIGSTSVRGTKQSTVGLRPERITDYIRLDIAEQVKQINAQTLQLLENNLARRADSIRTADGSSIGAWIDDHVRQHGTEPRPQAIIDMLDEQGWAPLPQRTGPITRSTPVTPKLVLAQMETQLGGLRSMPLQALSFLNRGFKNSVLALSPLWHMGQFIGNAFMAATIGKVSVLDMPRLARQIWVQTGGGKQLWDLDGMASWAPDELAHHGITAGEHQLLRDKWMSKDGSVNDSMFKRWINNSYRLGSFSDNFFRSMVYADQMQKMAADTGATGRMLDGQRAKGNDMTMSDAAVRHTLRALGDFTNMTPFERRVMREVFPFYSWIRHQTMMTMRMPLYSPMRAIFLVALTDALEDEDFANEFYDMMGSKVPIPTVDLPFFGEVDHLNLGNMSPFITPWDMASPINVNAAAGSLSPALRIGSQAVSGWDPGRLKPTTRPYEDRNIDIFGNEMNVPLARGLGGLQEIGYLAAGALPQTKAARDLLMDTDLLPGGRDRSLGQSRYGSGDARPHSDYDRDTSVLDVVLGGARMPRPESMEDRLYDLTQQMLERQGR